MDFLTVCTLISGMSLAITEKLKDVFKVADKKSAYLLSLVSPAVVTVLFVFLDHSIAEINLNGNLQTYVSYFVVSWLMSSGLYDFMKPVFKRK